MRTGRLLLASALLLATACTLIEGLAPVPTPAEGGVPDAKADANVSDVVHERKDDSGKGLPEASSDHFVAPIATAIATGQANPIGIVVDTSNVYWVDDVPEGSVMTVAASGATKPVSLVSGVDKPFSFVLAPPLIYLTCDNDTTAISTLPLGGGSLSVITQGTDVSQRWITKLGDDVYWTNVVDDGIWMYAVEAGDAGPNEPITGLSGPSQIAADVSGIYWVDQSGANVMKATLAGTDVTLLATSGAGPTYLAIDDKNVYWTASTSGEVRSVSKGGGASTLISGGEGGPAGVAVDSEYVYWADASDGRIRRASIGGAPTVDTITAGQKEPTSIAVAEGAVYWTNVGDGTVMKTTP
jgi:hypothetical protein